ncbi:MAG: hypothetical protein K8J31_13870 [Anaerolineae bacterium]|nr:hypothetical protein [Anaerolineae bacterium]
MSTLPAIILHSGWTCEYFELEPGLYEFAQDVRVPSLVEWAFDKRRVENWAAWLKRGFDLRPTDGCVSYFLYLDSAPEDTQIYVNGEKIGIYQQSGPDAPPFEVDVTPYVALEYNEIAFRVEWNAAGRFEGVRLQAVPCD